MLHEIQLSSSSDDVFAYDLKWNPTVPGMFCTVASDHTIGSFMVKTERKTTVGLVAMEKIQGHEVLCVAWSPKGKQIVVGCKNGNIVQLKPDLNVARTIAGPSPSVGGVIAILWISNYQFCATYQDPNDRCIKVLIVDAPKGEANGIFTCYDDITYGMPEAEQSPSRYYLDHVAEWGLIIAASSSSTEVAVLGSPDNGSTWEQWQLVDSGRAQLPLIRTTESYPVGMAIDRSSDMKLALGPETTLPHPVPVLHIFGTSGQLISFHMVNLGPNCPPLCAPPTEIVSAVQVPVPRQSLLPSEISFNLNSAATSTPRPKQAEVPIERPKISPPVNLFNEPAKPPVPAPVQQVELKIPKPRAEKVEPAPEKVEQRLSPVKEVNQPEKEAVDEGLCLRAYFEEQMLFEKELKAKLEPQTWICGTEEEQKKLVTQSATIDEFLRELRETTNSLSSDMAYLKALLLQSFAWLEETKSKNSANSTDNPRDRGDRNKIKELQRLFFYTQSQLMQATKALDMEWTEYESREKSMIKIPSLEFIYQSLKKHSEIIAKEKSVLEGHLKKWKALTRGKVSGLNRSMAKMNLSSSLASGSNNSDGGAIALRCKAIADNTRCFSVDKQFRLRDLLIETKPRIIKAINPSPVQDRLEATLSSLASACAAQNTPKTKPDRISTERAISAEQSIPKSTQQSPLASLNSIVAKFGPATTNESVIQSKTPSKVFSIGNSSTPLFGGNISQIDKKQTVSAPLMQAKPKQSITVTLNQQPSFSSSQMPSNPHSQAFSEVKSVQFGTPEQKTQEQPATTTSSDAFPKGLKLSNFKDSFNIGGSTFFQDTSAKPAAPVSSSGLTAAKIEPQNASTPTGTSTTFAGIPEGTTIQEVVRETPLNTFNFASSGQAALSSQQSSSTEVATPAANLQSFSFASKPIEPPAFSFALKDSAPASQAPAQASTDLPSLFDFDLASIGSQPFGKVTMPTTTLNFGGASPAAAQNTASSPLATSQPAPRTEVSSSTPVAASFFSNVTSSTTTTSFEKAPTSVSSASIFGSGPTEATAAATSIFGGAAASALSSSLFGGLSTTTNQSLPSPFNVAQQPTATTSSSESSTTSATPSIFGNAVSAATSPLAKTSTESSTTTFGKSPLNFSSSSFGGIIGAPASTLNFGATAAATTSPPAYDKAVEASSATNVFGQSPVVSSASPNVAKTTTTLPTPGMFGGTAGTSPNTPVFGSISATPSSTIFGGGSSAAPAPSVFEASSAPVAPFGSPTSATIFGGNVQKPSGSIFGGTAAAAMPTFGGVEAQTAASTGTAQATSPFGQSSAFGAKPVFGGQSSVFGAAKPEFSNPFGGSTFGSSAVPTGRSYYFSFSWLAKNSQMTNEKTIFFQQDSAAHLQWVVVHRLWELPRCKKCSAIPSARVRSNHWLARTVDSPLAV